MMDENIMLLIFMLGVPSICIIIAYVSVTIRLRREARRPKVDPLWLEAMREPNDKFLGGE